MVTGLIFDLDGTLFDSSAANIRAYSLAFQEANLKLNVKAYQKVFGLRFKEMMDAVAPGTDDKVRARIRTAKTKHYKENLRFVRPNAGLVELLRSCRPNYKTALVTTASKQNVKNLLSFFSVEESLFDVIITGEDVDKGKPDPECYNLAITSLGLSAPECCVFEDSVVGVQAAKQSGAFVIKVSL